MPTLGSVMYRVRWRSPAAVPGLVAVGLLLCAATPALAGPPQAKPQGQIVDREGSFEVLEQADQYAEARTAPAETIDPAAFSGAYAQAANLPLAPGTWSEITTKPYDSDAHGYRDPVWSNS